MLKGLGLRIRNLLERLLFGYRKLLLAGIALATVALAFMAAQLEVDAGFKKQLPLEHRYIKTFLEYEEQFGGANRLLVALMAKDGDMFDAEFFKALEQLERKIEDIPGVNRSRTVSIFDPSVRFVEVVEGGFAGGNVIPADFAPQSSGYDPTAEDFQQIKSNIVKAGIVGRYVAEDFDGAMVWAELLDRNPKTGEDIDYQAIAERLRTLDTQYSNDQQSVHIIGFAKIVGDVAQGAQSVVAFFGVAILITALLLYMYSRSPKLTALPIVCSLIAVIWQLGLLHTLGYGIDPMNILTPFLIFAIGVSHGVQMINAWSYERLYGGTSVDVEEEVAAGESWGAHSGVDREEAARRAFRHLLVPGAIALISDTIGFLTIYLIDIRMVQELAITASLGVALIILTNLILLPILLSYTRLRNLATYRRRALARSNATDWIWRGISHFADRRRAAVTVVVAVVLFGAGYWQAQGLQIGDSQRGVPELRQDSEYNRDARLISEAFSLSVDQLGVIAETVPNACTERYDVMRTIDWFAWKVRNVEGVQKVITLPWIYKVLTAGFNEGNIKWRVLPRDNMVLRQNLRQVPSSTGLRNTDCSAIPVLAFTEDHRATTIDRLVSAVENFEEDDRMEDLNLRLATGNVGVMAAVNDVVADAQMPILGWVYAAIIVLCVVTFRSLRGTVCVVAPLALVSVLAYWLMAGLNIGLKVNTLPVVALGVGIGVDYGIYIFSRLRMFMKQGMPLRQAYYDALQLTGKPVIFTALTLAVGVSTWLFSPLKFQADMGILLTFMFLLNMVGAIVVLPGLARWLLRPRERQTP